MVEMCGLWMVFDKEIWFEILWLRIDDYNVLRFDGVLICYGVVYFKNIVLGVLLLFENGDMLFVGQYCFFVDWYSWELLEGGGDFR